ncbi:GAF domain-containing protein [Candidatus Phyllobacterium onerii]|uniref:GAF domain-containing protein n=1 Tax=Candidatus Phyllobacterium onerii TaxID=3020828 RepID=UPI00232C3F21|nr:GAF domain-containing protein [Phyllobacterium sp. IY22]
MNDVNDNVDLTSCDREPIHIPGSIQPHGVLLVAERESLEIVGAAGDVEGRLWPEWSEKTLNDLSRQDIRAVLDNESNTNSIVLDPVRGISEIFEAVAHRSVDKLIVELEPAEIDACSTAFILADLDSWSSAFERSFNLRELCQNAATAFRHLTGFDRVMIYQFLDNGTGVVVAEDKAAALGTFLNHHFPATDIPKQARALYIRNRVRVIPDVSYDPAPLRSNKIELAELDLSDVNLRSVSPVHIQYLKNMQVQASASLSIVRDGVLWGLIACHHRSPRHLSLSKRIACRALAGGLARQIRAKDEAETYRERIHLRTSEDAMLRRMAIADPLDTVFSEYGGDFGEMLGADGFVASTDGQIYSAGNVPDQADVEALLDWATTKSAHQPFSTAELSKHYPPASRFSKEASGILSVTVPGDRRIALMWFRMEEIQMLNWAGNPHKDAALPPHQFLTPRASFEKWVEEVRGKSRPWTLNEMESARRLSHAVLEVVQRRQIEALNRELGQALAQKDRLLAKGFSDAGGRPPRSE